MHRHLLNKKFLKENLVKELSAQRLAYSTILMPEIEENASNIVQEWTDSANEEALVIKEENDPEVILKRLRGKCDPINYCILRDKALENEEQLMPKIIAMLVRSGNDVFIEHAARIIPKCRKNYSNDLLNILEEVRNPYAVSMICLVIGFIGSEEIIPIIYKKYHELKRLYPDDSYDQGPLLALLELRARFYN